MNRGKINLSINPAKISKMVKDLPQKKMSCPFCSTYFEAKDLVDFNDVYVRCPNTQCFVSWIPRSSDKKYQVISLLPYLETIICANSTCRIEYYPYCVPHNEYYSECPSCRFKNSHDKKTHRIVSIYNDYENKTGHFSEFLKCTQCSHLFDGTLLAKTNNDEEILQICSDCIDKNEDDFQKWLGLPMFPDLEPYSYDYDFSEKSSRIVNVDVKDYPHIGFSKHSKLAELEKITSGYLSSLSSLSFLSS
jgi:hypothetical protein